MRYCILFLLVLSTSACSGREYYLWKASNSLTNYHQTYYLEKARRLLNEEQKAQAPCQYYGPGLGSIITNCPRQL